MRKNVKKLLLHRETLHRMTGEANELRGVAGGYVIPTRVTCGHPCSAACTNTCTDVSCGTCPPVCSVHNICGQ